MGEVAGDEGDRCKKRRFKALLESRLAFGLRGGLGSGGSRSRFVTPARARISRPTSRGRRRPRERARSRSSSTTRTPRAARSRTGSPGASASPRSPGTEQGERLVAPRAPPRTRCHRGLGRRAGSGPEVGPTPVLPPQAIRERRGQNLPVGLQQTRRHLHGRASEAISQGIRASALTQGPSDPRRSGSWSSEVGCR
jgi:hypothetical protein